MVTRSGSVVDIPVILILTTTLIIGVVTATLVLSEVRDATTDDQIDQDTLTAGIDALSIFDKGIIVVFAGLFLVTIVFSFLIPTNPIFAIPAILFLGVTTWLAGTMSNVLWQFFNVEPITTTVNNQFPTFVIFVENWPVVTAGLGLAVIIALYMRGQSRPEVGV